MCIEPTLALEAMDRLKRDNLGCDLLFGVNKVMKNVAASRHLLVRYEVPLGNFCGIILTISIVRPTRSRWVRVPCSCCALPYLRLYVSTHRYGTSVAMPGGPGICAGSRIFAGTEGMYESW